eukprot:2713974-Heterocapsa_arctica.AAC.1
MMFKAAEAAEIIKKSKTNKDFKEKGKDIESEQKDEAAVAHQRYEAFEDDQKEHISRRKKQQRRRQRPT